MYLKQDNWSSWTWFRVHTIFRGSGLPWGNRLFFGPCSSFSLHWMIDRDWPWLIEWWNGWNNLPVLGCRVNRSRPSHYLWELSSQFGTVSTVDVPSGVASQKIQGGVLRDCVFQAYARPETHKHRCDCSSSVQTLSTKNKTPIHRHCDPPWNHVDYEAVLMYQ